MSIVPTNLASSMAGTQGAERVEGADKRKRAAEKARQKAKPPASTQQEADEVIVQVETAEAVRNLASNEQEEAHGDHQARPRYDAKGKSTKDGPPSIDVQG
jgi:hypothetical protein